jgi:hypothetical protein
MIRDLRKLRGSKLTFKFHSMQDVTNSIVAKLHHHPLALANVGINISRSHASDPNYWKLIQEDLQSYLDVVSITDARPILYDTPYSLSLRASMMVMLKGLRPEVFPLLGLIALFEGPCFPEDLLKLFYRRLSQSSLEYFAQVNYLEARSLIEMREKQSTDEIMVSMCPLRTHYIRETRNVDIKALALHVLGGSSGQEEAEQLKDEGILTVIIAAVEFAEPFLSEVATRLEHLVRINNGGEIPPPIRDLSFLSIARTIRSHHEFRLLYRFLNHCQESGWKQQACQYSKKVMLTNKHELVYQILCCLLCFLQNIST